MLVSARDEPSHVVAACVLLSGSGFFFGFSADFSTKFLKFVPHKFHSKSQVPPSTSAFTTAVESSPSTMDATQRPVLATLNSKRTFVGAQAKPSPARKRIHVPVHHSNSLADIAMAYPTPVTVAPPKAAAAVRMFGPGEFELSQRVECRHRLCLCTLSSKPPTNHRSQKISILNSFGLSLKTLQQVHLHRLPALEMTSTWICPQMLCHFAQSRCLEKVSPGEIDSSLVCQNCCCCNNSCFETF
jgi:hypothetical protein